jgi:hypothetical protein
MGPIFSSGYGKNYLWADGAPDAEPDDSVEFIPYVIPQDGTWGVSLWWPMLADGNPQTRVEIQTTSSNPDQQLVSSIVDQHGTSPYRLRSTVALPNPGSPGWYLLPSFDLKKNEVITVRVMRRSDARGKVLADAVRFLKT